MSQNLADLRMDYAKDILDESTIPTDPLQLFHNWFTQHQTFCKDTKVFTEPNAVALATCDPDTLQPSVLLLKSYDVSGFVFFTNYESRKGKEIQANPLAAFTFYWDQRQVRIEGKIVKVSPEDNNTYFHSRPIGSQISAIVSSQSQAINNRKQLEDLAAELELKYSKYADGLIERPDYWGGYRLVPHAMEFWQGRQSRLHDRFRFTKVGSKWTNIRLAP